MNLPTRTGIAPRSRVRGFTLIEVMVALVITAIGLLGIAKIQALAYASTGSAGLRSLVALQASSLAASMHADRTYWSGLQGVVTITGTNITGVAALATPAFCKSGGADAPCDPPHMAAYDLQQYASDLASPTTGLLFNLNPLTTITCAVVAANPVSCTIVVTWNEHAVSINAQSAAITSQATFAPTYMLYVEP